MKNSIKRKNRKAKPIIDKKRLGFKLNEVYAQKLHHISSTFGLSNCRSLQACMAYSFNQDSLIGAFRQHKHTELAKVIYIPFLLNDYNNIKLLKKLLGYGSLYELFRIAIDKTINDIENCKFSPDPNSKRYFYK